MATKDQLSKIKALFANIDNGNQGSELLLCSVREIMKGELVLQGTQWATRDNDPEGRAGPAVGLRGTMSWFSWVCGQIRLGQWQLASAL